MDIYREEILDQYKHPHNFGHLPAFDHAVTIFNSACGDKITMELQFDETNENVIGVAFSGDGCAISMASASILTDKIKGMSVPSVLALTPEDILSFLNTPLTPTRMKCALLPLEAVHKCVLEGKTA